MFPELRREVFDMSTVIGVFQNREDAEKAANDLRDKGLHERISIAARGEDKKHGGESGKSGHGRGAVAAAAGAATWR
jgi:tRNA(Ile2) C34 agmatinyltransferase TiaS